MRRSETISSVSQAKQSGLLQDALLIYPRRWCRVLFDFERKLFSGQMVLGTWQGLTLTAILLRQTKGTTWQTGQDAVVRGRFISNGSLANTADTYFRPISYSWPVFGFSHDLGTVASAATEPVVFVVGHVRDPAIQYVTKNNGRQERSVLFWTKFKTVSSAISTFIHDYTNALARANAFDAKVKADASKISSDYAGVVALSVRQALGSIEITVSKKSGRYDQDDVLTFMKEISSDGNVNTVDVIFPAWPIFLYTNPALGKQLLAPLFEYQATGQYPNRWAVHDMGSSYPKAVGHNDGQDEAMQVEESGNMLIMTLSLAKKANDTTLIKKYYNLLDQWTQYLIEDSLIPALQLSTDDFAGRLANQTNLAIKGIVGIKAMSKIADIVGDHAKAKNYSDIATSYVQQWQNLALSSDRTHLTLAYGNDSSWGLAYNLYADRLLNTSVFPQSIFDLRESPSFEVLSQA